MLDKHRAILVANGDVIPGPALDSALEAAKYGAFVIGVDGGTDLALSLGLEPSLVIGDLDSIQPATLQNLEAQGVEIRRYPPDKNETDLELALIAAADQGATWIRVVAALGDRLDQTFANIYLLALPALQDIDVRLVSGKQTISLISAGYYAFAGQIGDTISLIPFGGDAVGITTHHMKYPLRDETLYIGPARGVSNVIAAADAGVTFTEGRLLVVHTIGRA